MAGFTVIADVGNALVKIFREHMVPDVIPNADAIGLCHPADKGDFMLGIHLYDVKENMEIFERGMQNVDLSTQRYPSQFLELYYMITPYSMSDVKFRAVEEQRILGRAMQVLMDYGNLSGQDIGSQNSSYTVHAQMLRLDMEDKMKLWNIPEVPYKASLYYKVTPVELESTRRKQVRRVTEAEINVKKNG